jgi:hypothetical protein
MCLDLRKSEDLGEIPLLEKGTGKRKPKGSCVRRELGWYQDMVQTGGRATNAAAAAGFPHHRSCGKAPALVALDAGCLDLPLESWIRIDSPATVAPGGHGRPRSPCGGG